MWDWVGRPWNELFFGRGAEGGQLPPWDALLSLPLLQPWPRQVCYGIYIKWKLFHQMFWCVQVSKFTITNCLFCVNRYIICSTFTSFCTQYLCLQVLYVQSLLNLCVQCTNIIDFVSDLHLCRVTCFLVCTGSSLYSGYSHGGGTLSPHSPKPSKSKSNTGKID